MTKRFDETPTYYLLEALCAMALIASPFWVVIILWAISGESQ